MRVHEAIDLLAALAPDVHKALAAAKAAGVTHVNLDGTLIHTDRVAQPGPNGADLWSSGKHNDHGGNVQALPYLSSFPASSPRYARDANTTPPARRRPPGYYRSSKPSRPSTRSRR